MDREELVRRLMGTFVGELEEQVRELDRLLLALESQPEGAGRSGTLKELFRVAHGLKGAARAVNVESIEAACHRMESILADARDGVLPVSPELLETLFAAADAIEEAGRCLREERDPAGAGASLGTMRPRVDAASRRGTMHAAEEPAAPAPAEAIARPAEAIARPEEPIAQPERRAIRSGSDAQLRIRAAKLDALLSASGELRVARRRCEPRSSEVAELLGLVTRWRRDWVEVERPLRALVRASAAGARKAAAAPLSQAAARVVDQAGENLQRLERGLASLASALAADRRALEQAAAPLERGVLEARMLPFGESCEGLARAVRDLGKSLGKEIDLVIEGGDIELDRAVQSAIQDPLLQLVRNAVDHGLETPADRVAAGKPPRGRIRVAAALRGDRVRVVVEDDGRGLDLTAVTQAAARRGLASPIDAQDAARIIFQSGVSTAPRLTEISGRGVGLDIVRSRLEELNGSAECESDPGRGTRFVLDIPLTLTMVRALLVSASGQTYALPQANVKALLRMGADEIRSVEGRDTVSVDGVPVPLVPLTQILSASWDASCAGGKVSVVVLTAGSDRAAFSVDELLAEQELIVKNLGPRLRRVRHLSGGTVLPSGHVALILNAADLIQSAVAPDGPRRSLSRVAAAPSLERRRLLVVDDSVINRALLKNILEAAGFVVLAAADGAEAWRLLEEKGADLVVSDVEMPSMNGFELTAAIRKSPRYHQLPVVLVTGLESDRDKARGLEVGADAYLPKSGFEQKQLLEAIGQLL